MTRLCWSTWFRGNSMEEIKQTLWGSWWTWHIWNLSFLWKITGINGEDIRKQNKTKSWHWRRHCNVSRFSETYMFICCLISSIEIARFEVHVISMYIRSLCSLVWVKCGQNHRRWWHDPLSCAFAFLTIIVLFILKRVYLYKNILGMTHCFSLTLLGHRSVPA